MLRFPGQHCSKKRSGRLEISGTIHFGTEWIKECYANKVNDENYFGNVICLPQQRVQMRMEVFKNNFQKALLSSITPFRFP